jgi:WD40 repeat protein
MTNSQKIFLKCDPKSFTFNSHCVKQNHTIMRYWLLASSCLLLLIFLTSCGTTAVNKRPDLPPDTPQSTGQLDAPPIAGWRTLEGYTNRVIRVRFSPDGKFLISSGDDRSGNFGGQLRNGTENSVKLWSTQTGEEVKAFNIKSKSAEAGNIAVSPDGKKLACVGSNDSFVSIWSLETGEELIDIKERGQDVAFSPDGKLLAGLGSWGNMRGVFVWSVETGQVVQEFELRSPRAIAFSADGKLIAASGYATKDRSSYSVIKLFSLESGGTVRELTGFQQEISSLAFSKDGTMLVSGGNDDKVRVWSVRNGEVLHTFEHTANVAAVAISPDGSQVLSGGADKDNAVRLWSIPEKRLLNVLSGHSGKIQSLDFSPDGMMAASCSDDKTIKLWKLGEFSASPLPALKVSATVWQNLAGHQDDVMATAFSPDGSTFASIAKDNTIKLWTLQNGLNYKTITEKTMGLYGTTPLVFSPDSKTLAVSCYERGYVIKLFAVKSGAEVQMLRELSETIWSIAFSPDGKLIAGMSNSGLKIWNVQTGKEEKIIKHTVYGVGGRSVCFTPDGSKLITANSEGRTLKVWSVKTGAELKSIEGDNSPGAILISADKQFVICGNNVWSLQSGKKIRELMHIAAAQSPNGKYFIGFQEANERLNQPAKVAIMNASTGREILPVDRHGGWKAAVSMSADGTRLATVDSEGLVIRLWNLSGLTSE